MMKTDYCTFRCMISSPLLKRIRLQTLLNRVNHTLRNENMMYFALEKDRDKDSLSAYLKIFFNTQIREGTGINDTKRLVAEFEKYYSAKMMKKIGDAKSDAGKKKYTDATPFFRRCPPNRVLLFAQTGISGRRMVC